MSEPAKQHAMTMWIVAFALLLAAATVLGLSIVSRTLGSGSSWLAILFSAAAIGVSVYSVMVGPRRS